MTLIRGRTHAVFCVSLALAFIILVPAGLAVAGEPIAISPPRPATEVPVRPLSDAELEKINRMIADKGSEIRLNREVTVQLGVTRGDELLLSRGVAVKDEMGDVHEFEPLPGDKGYLILRLSPQLNTIYWVGKDFVPKAALSRVPGQPAAELPVADAQTGAGKELAFWAAFMRE